MRWSWSANIFSHRKPFSSASMERLTSYFRETKQNKVFCMSLYSSHSNLKCWICYITVSTSHIIIQLLRSQVLGVDEPEEESVALSMWLPETNTDPSRPHQGATATKCQALKLGAISFLSCIQHTTASPWCDLRLRNPCWCGRAQIKAALVHGHKTTPRPASCNYGGLLKCPCRGCWRVGWKLLSELSPVI